ncbi:MAG: glycosyltransferase family 2 protein [Actinobacteria bacterium]|nr:glycosyltransferase family 2 protein [Actinomycetota bacterium]
MGSLDLRSVPGQDWKQLDVPALGSWQPDLRVGVVVPARDCQEELDRTLAALAEQSYPVELTEVVVVDDGSSPPLRLGDRRPAATTLVRIEQEESHGSGRARHVGSTRTEADVLLFLDADMVADRFHVEAHARWHHLTPHAVVLGRKWFVDFTGLGPQDVGEATAGAGLETLLEGREREGHGWQEEFIRGREELTTDSEDCFLAVVGATVSLRQDLYQRTGGFASLGLRGIVDTEFGYRAFTSGGLLVPDGQALAYHQGSRSFTSHGNQIKRERTGLAANYLPTGLFRPGNTGRRWAVPMAVVVVDAEGSQWEEVQFTADSVLASDFTDLVVSIVVGDTEPPPWLLDYFGQDDRVRFCAQPPTSAYPSPLSMTLSPGLLLRTGTVSQMTRVLEKHRAGVVRTHPGDLDGRVLEVWRTRALLRAMTEGPQGLEERAATLFGECWVSARALGVTTGRFGITRQGMIVAKHGPLRSKAPQLEEAGTSAQE